MFGDKKIELATEVKFQRSHKLPLPEITEVESQEKLGLIYDLKRTKLLIYNLQELQKLLQEILQVLDEKLILQEISEKKYRQYRRYLFAKLYQEDVECDDKKRITIPLNVIKHLNLSEKVYMVGKDTHLEIYPSQESFEAIEDQALKLS